MARQYSTKVAGDAGILSPAAAENLDLPFRDAGLVQAHNATLVRSGGVSTRRPLRIVSESLPYPKRSALKS